MAVKRFLSFALPTMAACLALSACTSVRYHSPAGTSISYTAILQRKSFIVEAPTSGPLTVRYNTDSDALTDLMREVRTLAELAAKGAIK